MVATNEQDKLGHTTFGQEGEAKQKRDSIGSAMSEKWATCEAGCGEAGKLKRKVICRWFLIYLLAFDNQDGKVVVSSKSGLF